MAGRSVRLGEGGGGGVGSVYGGLDAGEFYEEAEDLHNLKYLAVAVAALGVAHEDVAHEPLDGLRVLLVEVGVYGLRPEAGRAEAEVGVRHEIQEEQVGELALHVVEDAALRRYLIGLVVAYRHEHAVVQLVDA